MSQDYKFRFSVEELLELVRKNPNEYSYFKTTSATTPTTQFILGNIMSVVERSSGYCNTVYEKINTRWTQRFITSEITFGVQLYFFDTKESFLFSIGQEKGETYTDFLQKVLKSKDKILEIGLDRQTIKLYFPFFLTPFVKNSRNTII